MKKENKEKWESESSPSAGRAEDEQEGSTRVGNGKRFEIARKKTIKGDYFLDCRTKWGLRALEFDKTFEVIRADFLTINFKNS